ncbi:hypothetical protein [Paenibacillus hamazuiensis]|uniref:hypothetical protein n=1 Tax=Paenibacillus hamazuiensis TaxID=2936508 RepID=UPI00200BB1FC|nr:hypothetical protein [Paenibacillus hamazuiensis]
MKYEERIIAFIDILGFKNLVNDESKCEDIGAILKLPYLIRQDNMAKMLKIKGVMMTSISDSLVFSIRLKERGAMNKITKLLTVFTQSLLSQHGLLLRGGIAVGKIYHDNDIVYGPGLVKAYELESKIAVYPRIVMGFSDFESSILSCSQISQSALRERFVTDNDYFLMLDCFHYTNQQTLEFFRHKLEQMKTMDLGAQQKINWMKAWVDRKLKEISLQKK